jgi:hypothetical protein
MRASDEILVALVRRIHGDGDVGEHRLRSRRRNDEASARLADDRVRDVVERARLVVKLRLLVAQRREAARTPVNDPMSLVDQTSFVQSNECLAHGARQLG